MILKIINKDRFVGTEFWNGRFKCLQVHETVVNYRFQFDDDKLKSCYHWVEVSKIGHYNSIEQKWEYRLNYKRCGSHIVTAKWFEDWENAMNTFGSALKKQL